MEEEFSVANYETRHWTTHCVSNVSSFIGLFGAFRVRLVTCLLVHFLSGRSSAYEGGVLGMAFVGTVCSASSSGGINVVSSTAI